MKTTNAHGLNESELIAKFKDQTPMTILSQDLKSTIRLFKTEETIDLVSRQVKVVEQNYFKTEREIMTRFAFDFYADLSRQMGVPENLISENLTHAEIYFDEKFNRK